MDDLLHRALELIETGNLDAAGEIIEAVIGEEPNNARAWRLRAQVATERGEKVAYLKRALELAPRHLETREQLKELGEDVPDLSLEPDDTAPIILDKPEVNIDKTLVSSRTQVLETRVVDGDQEPESPETDSTTVPVAIKEQPQRRGCMWAILLLFVVLIGGGIVLMVVAPDQPQIASLWALIRPSPTPTVTATPPPTETDLPTQTAIPTLTTTPLPTATIPTPTPYPTYTPAPTDTPMPTPLPSESLDGGTLAIMATGDPQAPALQGRDNFGWSVDVEDDTFVVGAPGESNSNGSVYVYTREGEDWRLQQRLSSDSPENSGDLFGWSVALDGDRLVVGAPGGRPGQVQEPFPGTIYVYTRQDSEWQFTATAGLEQSASGQFFGWSVDVDGDTVAVGAPAINPAGEQPGLVYLLQIGSFPELSWISEQTISVANDETTGVFFGYSVTLDGDTLVAGGQPLMGMGDDTVHVFRFEDGSWVERARLKNEDRQPEDRFGFAIAVNGSRIAVSNVPVEGPLDGNTVLIYDGSIFTEEPDTWKPITTISNPAGEFAFGHALALDDDTLVIGAPWLGQPGNQAGRVFVYRYDGTDWVGPQSLSIIPTFSAPGDLSFSTAGWAVAVSGDQVVAGSPNEFAPPKAGGLAILFSLAP